MPYEGEVRTVGGTTGIYQNGQWGPASPMDLAVGAQLAQQRRSAGGGTETSDPTLAALRSAGDTASRTGTSFARGVAATPGLLYQTVRHPLDTLWNMVSGTASAIAHPVQTVQALSDPDVGGEAIGNLVGGLITGRAIPQIPRVAGKIVPAATKIAQGVSKPGILGGAAGAYEGYRMGGIPGAVIGGGAGNMGGSKLGNIGRLGRVMEGLGGAAAEAPKEDPFVKAARGSTDKSWAQQQAEQAVKNSRRRSWETPGSSYPPESTPPTSAPSAPSTPPTPTSPLSNFYAANPPNVAGRLTMDPTSYARSEDVRQTMAQPDRSLTGQTTPEELQSVLVGLKARQFDWSRGDVNPIVKSWSPDVASEARTGGTIGGANAPTPTFSYEDEAIQPGEPPAVGGTPISRLQQNLQGLSPELAAQLEQSPVFGKLPSDAERIARTTQRNITSRWPR